MRIYYYCQRDNYGQRTGLVKSVKLNKSQVCVNKGLKMYNGILLYDSDYEATLSALS